MSLFDWNIAFRYPCRNRIPEFLKIKLLNCSNSGLGICVKVQLAHGTKLHFQSVLEKSRIVKIGFCFQPSMADNLLPVVVEGFIKNELESDEEILTEIHHPLYSESCHEETANLRYCAKPFFCLMLSFFADIWVHLFYCTS